MQFPPPKELIAQMATRIRAEVEIRRGCSFWMGGTIFLVAYGWGADVSATGDFKKIFHQEGLAKEYFSVE